MLIPDSPGRVVEIAAVLFDLGNTLTASASLAASLAHLAQTSDAAHLNLSGTQLTRLGQEIEHHIDMLYQARETHQPYWFDVWQTAVTHCGLDLNPDDIERLGRAHLRQFLRECTVQPTSIPLLAALRKANIPLALVSNATGPVDLFDIDLREKGLAEFFRVVVWSSAVGYRKPAPNIFQAALDGLGLCASKAILMVGDHELADVLGGKQMGFTTIKVVKSTDETESAADCVVARATLLEFFQLSL